MLQTILRVVVFSFVLGVEQVESNAARTLASPGNCLTKHADRHVGGGFRQLFSFRLDEAVGILPSFAKALGEGVYFRFCHLLIPCARIRKRAASPAILSPGLYDAGNIRALFLMRH